MSSSVMNWDMARIIMFFYPCTYKSNMSYWSTSGLQHPQAAGDDNELARLMGEHGNGQ